MRSDSSPARPLLGVTSDNHLEPHAWANHPDLRGDSYYALEQTVDWCYRKNVGLLLAGDVFNVAYPDAHSVNVAHSQLYKMRLRNLPVWYVQGQHEYHHTTPWLSIVPGATHLHRKKLVYPANQAPGPYNQGVCFYGLDFTRADQLQNELKQIPEDAEVLVAHQVWLERMGRKSAPEGSFKDIPKVRVVITGDFHGHGVDKFVGADDQEITVLSPGSQCMQDVTEDHRKYFFLLYDDLTFESVPLKGREKRWYVFRNQGTFEDDLAKAVADAEMQEGVPEHIAMPLFVANYSDAIIDAKTRLRSALAHRVHLFARSIEIKKEEEGERAEPPAPEGLTTKLASRYRDQPEVYATAKRLLEVPDPKSELITMIRGALEGSHNLNTWPPEEGPGGKLGID